MDLARSDVVTVSPDDTVAQAISLMLAEGVDHLPVVTAEGLVGMFTRTDVLEAQSRAIAAERRDAGWRPRFPRRV